MRIRSRRRGTERNIGIGVGGGEGPAQEALGRAGTLSASGKYPEVERGGRSILGCQPRAARNRNQKRRTAAQDSGV
jgi:hypothetical protein